MGLTFKPLNNPHLFPTHSDDDERSIVHSCDEENADEDDGC